MSAQEAFLSHRALLIIIVMVIGVIPGSLLVWLWIEAGRLVCVHGTVSESLEKTIAILDGLVTNGFTIAIPMLGAALGVLSGFLRVRCSSVGDALLTSAIVLLGQSILAGYLWKNKVASAHFNKCLNLISEDALTRLYQGWWWLLVFGTVLSACAMIDIGVQRGRKTA